MYDMYPDEWGYGQHRTGPYDGPGRRGSAPAADAVQTALDLRDNGAPRPDDN